MLLFDRMNTSWSLYYICIRPLSSYKQIKAVDIENTMTHIYLIYSTLTFYETKTLKYTFSYSYVHYKIQWKNRTWDMLEIVYNLNFQHILTAHFRYRKKLYSVDFPSSNANRKHVVLQFYPQYQHTHDRFHSIKPCYAQNWNFMLIYYTKVMQRSNLANLSNVGLILF